MSGVRLMELEASDMLDVLHFLFEDDFTAVGEEHARARSNIREHLYSDLYGVPYAFKMKPRKDDRRANGMAGFRTADDDFSLDDVQPVNPRDNNPFELKESKAKFVSAESMPILIETSFKGLDGPLN